MTGDELKVWREERKIGQAELARLLGVTPITVWRWEQRRRGMPGEMLRLALVGLERERDFHGS